MQIMNFDKQVKSLVSFLGASDVIKDFPDSVFITDLEGYIKEVNTKAKLVFGIGEDVPYVKIDHYIKDAMDLVASSIRKKKAVLGTGYLKEKEFYIELSASRTEKNYYISVRDVTHAISEIELKDKINRFNAEKNIMLSKLESELISPVDSILGFSKGMIDGLGGDLSEKQLKYIKIINTSAKDLHCFVEKFIEFSNAESSLYDPDYKQFDIVSEIKDVLKHFEQNETEINFEYDSVEKRAIYTDLKIIKKALKNILEVSLSTVESGIVSLIISPPNEEMSLTYGLNEEKKYISIIVKDSGKGFDAKTIKAICDPYLQLDKGRRDLLQAFKLGAASIMIKRASGYFDISSEVMAGTVYTIILPVEKEKNE